MIKIIKALLYVLAGVRSRRDLVLLQQTSFRNVLKMRKAFRRSRAQLHQDVFVLSTLNFCKNGFFVEFGATNGVDLSNTLMLERDFGWSGILAEPARCWHGDITKNRACQVDTRCVWSRSGESLQFKETAVAELSTITDFSNSDIHGLSRQSGQSYNVSTVSLNDLLSEHGAPSTIDYLSIDTEGSEFEILSRFDFSRHIFRVITCEHNFTSKRADIFDLLTTHGYKRVNEDLSDFDDWYIYVG